MKLLKEKIMSEGLVLNDAILKVDSFLKVTYFNGR